MRFEDLKDTFYVVESTSFEVLNHWRHCDESEKYEIEQDSLGFGQTIGYVGDMPVAISLQRYKINGRWVVFYEATSQVVDHRMVRTWINENVLVHCPQINGRNHHTDAWNFGHCLIAIERANTSE